MLQFAAETSQVHEFGYHRIERQTEKFFIVFFFFFSFQGGAKCHFKMGSQSPNLDLPRPTSIKWCFFEQ